jgi:hypothetical protein
MYLHDLIRTSLVRSISTAPHTNRKHMYSIDSIQCKKGQYYLVVTNEYPVLLPGFKKQYDREIFLYELGVFAVLYLLQYCTGVLGVILGYSSTVVYILVDTIKYQVKLTRASGLCSSD